MLLELKRALRLLAKSPSFSLTAIVTLAICLGASLTIYAVVDAILIRSLPYPDADRLVTLYYTYPRLPTAHSGASLTSYYERRGKIPALESIAAIDLSNSVIGETGATVIERVGRVTPEFFSTLKVPLLMGRAFEEAELTYQTDQKVIITAEYWKSHYNGDPQILGKLLRLDGIPRTIVGVLPPNFQFLSSHPAVYLPLSSDPVEHSIVARHSLNVIEIGRIAPGATLSEVKAQVAALDQATAAEFPDAKFVTESGCETVVKSLHANHVEAVRPMLLSLQAGALCLLLIGAANLTHLFLIRASARLRELAIKQALGASGKDVFRGVMIETFTVSLIGGAAGLAVAAAAIHVLPALGASQLPLANRVAFDLRLALAALAGVLVLTLIVGVPIVWFLLHHRLAGALQSRSAGVSSPRMQRARQGFIVAQIALAFLLTSGAALLALSLKRAAGVQPGFKPDQVITGQFTLTWNGYHTNESFHRFFNQLDDRLHSLPGIGAAGAASVIPLSGKKSNGVIRIPGFKGGANETSLIHNMFGVAGDYFAAMGIPLRSGRYLTADDPEKAAQVRVCVVDENLAKHYWPRESAVGKLLFVGADPQPDEKPYTIVGVVGAVKQDDLTEKPIESTIYFPYTDRFSRDYFLVVRTTLTASATADLLVKAMHEIDPEIPLGNFRPLPTVLRESLAPRRSPALLAGVFAAAALLLASVGLYGGLGYTVSQRTREFGIRMALGATHGNVLRLVVTQGLRLAVIGLAIGGVATLFSSELLTAMLFGVQPNDPVVVLGTLALLITVATVACLIPARRATRVDPAVSLRAE